MRPAEYKRSRLARNRKIIHRAYGGVLSALLDRSIYLVPVDLKVGQFVYVIHNGIKFSYVMLKIYEENKDEDGFLCHKKQREFIWSSHFQPSLDRFQ
ncbi:hypothetical protein IEQ34_017921 [Dendrobium chrysotoxum]|uniref:Uncharacterized protein n=1 Tax=Dendrobium chrysotoxum TaxID=161865 RepID=A0AAV7GBH5_DENCH|nr:hypothetical protein IEQ34_017921 [Dendrobium chrysotoxum]